MKKFIKEYRVEIAALIVIAAGIFLIIEPFAIRATLMRTINQFYAWLRTLGSGLLDTLVTYVQRFTLSDFLGWAMTFLAAVFILWRLRVRFRKAHKWVADTCPLCGSRLHRVHRTKVDRLVSKILLSHAYRYRCSNAQCGWSGLRYSKPHEHHHKEELNSLPTDAS